MSLALHILLGVLLAILGLIGLVLVTPFRLRLRGERRTGLGHLEGYAGVPLRILGVRVCLSEARRHFTIYLLGIPLWRRPLPFEKLVRKKDRAPDPGGHTADTKPRKEKRERKRPAKKKAPYSLDDFAHLLRTPHVGAVARRLLRLLNPRGALDLEVGFDDPSTTGMVAAVVGCLQELAGLDTRIRYNFAGAELKGSFLLGVTLWIPQIVIGIAVTALAKDGRELIAHLWGLRKRRLARAA